MLGPGAGAAPGPTATLDEWLDWQTRQHPRAIELGLTRVTEVADRLGLRQQPPLTLIIAGTNGKGACTVLAADILRRAGKRVGRFTSPHLRRYNERVHIDGADVDDGALVTAFCAIEAVRGDVPLTYFEYGTLAALWLFRAAGCEVQVLEVGLGGRLDAVNLLDADAALVTSIGLDHGDWLGHTVEAVAREKAGVFRAGRPAFWAEPEWPSTVADALAANGITPSRLPAQLPMSADGWQLPASRWGDRQWPMPRLPGAHQVRNAAAVLRLLDTLGDRLHLPPEIIIAALAAWQVPGRCERRGRLLLDVAHNTEAMQALIPVLRQQPAPVVAILGMLDDKPVEAVGALLSGVVSALHLVDLPPPRGLSADALQARLAGQVPVSGTHATMAAALAATEAAETVLVCGSFLTVAAALEALDG